MKTVGLIEKFYWKKANLRIQARRLDPGFIGLRLTISPVERTQEISQQEEEEEH